MALTLMYITNNPAIAEIAQTAGVDRIWVDMEYIGKDERQGGLDTVKSSHTIADIKKLRPVVTTSELMVRVNPIHEASDRYLGTEEEVEQTIAAGADVIMLPMFRTKADVARFLQAVNGRAKTVLLFETAEAVENVDDILSLPGIDEVHIGLNDLHLAYKMKFMFELLCEGTVQSLCEKFKARGIKYGFGGIARVGLGMLPAEYIITEHYRLGSEAAILSRGFCDANRVEDPQTVRDIFNEGVRNIRLKEAEVSALTQKQYEENLEIIREKVGRIVAGR
ncbi:MAG: aldolase [Oscillospiraceae bacterium]|nr:aldolase [Oscillospiraceae bacterium]MBQ8769522.1 aldolase [Oscillospiraceae bacterium]